MTKTIYERPEYSGRCGMLHETLTLPNKAQPVSNEVILEAARRTRKEFYDEHCELLVAIQAKAEGRSIAKASTTKISTEKTTARAKAATAVKVVAIEGVTTKRKADSAKLVAAKIAATKRTGPVKIATAKGSAAKVGSRTKASARA